MGKPLEFTLTIEGVDEEDYLRVWEELADVAQKLGRDGVEQVRLWVERHTEDGGIEDLVEVVSQPASDPDDGPQPFRGPRPL